MKNPKLPIKQIRIKDRARKSFPHIPELMESIRNVGLINPVLVHDDEDGYFTLLAGECRLKACLLLGWSEIPFTTRENLTDKQKLLIELEENIRRKQLEWTERVEILKQLDEGKREEFGHASRGNLEGHNMDKLAAVTGMSRTQAAFQVKLAEKLRERPDVKELVKDLPLHAAAKRFDQIVEAQDLARQALEGVIKVSNDLRLGDALTLIKELKDDSVDCIVTDPPFGIEGLKQKKTTSSVSRPTSYKMTLTDEDNLDMQGVVGLMLELVPELKRVLKPGGHLYMFFCNDMYAKLRGILEVNGFIVSPVPLIWDKMRTTHPFNGFGYTASYEPILFAQNVEKSRRLSEPCRDILQFKPADVGGRIHPFQKPLSLLKKLIEQSTFKGHVVLDPFAGSGSTLIAARDCGRSGIGFEMGEEHYQLAQKRLMEKRK